MNQILITGEEQVTEQVKVKKQKKVIPIKAVARFYAISIIILGICMISGSVFANKKINEVVEANMKPEISLERNDDNTITITVTHIRELKEVKYNWTGDETKLIKINNEKSISEIINLKGGRNTLNVYAVDESGQAQTLEKLFIAENIPEIESIESVDNGVKVSVKCEDKLDYLQYNWDNGEMQKIEISEKKYEGIINAPKGMHILKIKVVSINGIKSEIVKEVIGDTEPTVNVQSQLIDEKPTFVIDAEDDELITTITIIHNGGEKQVITVNKKTYHGEVKMIEGGENTIIVTATNKNSLQKTRRIRVK